MTWLIFDSDNEIPRPPGPPTDMGGANGGGPHPEIVLWKFRMGTQYTRGSLDMLQGCHTFFHLLATFNFHNFSTLMFDMTTQIMTFYNTSTLLTRAQLYRSITDLAFIHSRPNYGLHPWFLWMFTSIHIFTTTTEKSFAPFISYICFFTERHPDE